MHGYPQFSFEIPKAFAKFCFLRIVLTAQNIPVLVGTTHRKPRVSRDAQNVCAVTILGTVLKAISIRKQTLLNKVQYLKLINFYPHLDRKESTIIIIMLNYKLLRMCGLQFVYNDGLKNYFQA